MEEAGVVVPLIPDRAETRPAQTRSWTGRAPASGTRPTIAAVITIAATAVAAPAVAAGSGWVPSPAALAIATLVPAAVVDAEQHRIPDFWIGAATIALVVTMTITGAAGGHVDIVGTLMGAAAMCVPIMALHLVSPAAMGFGDVKTSVVLGAALGTVDWRLAPVALCLAAFGGAGVGLAGRRRTIAFGPFLVFGAWAVLLTHGPVVDHLFTVGATP